MLLLTAAEMRECDRLTIEELGIPGVVLMELAGRGCAEAARELLQRQHKEVNRADIAVVTGSGNNGGDGYVVARHLLNQGARVTTYLLSPPERLRGDAKINYDILARMGADRVELYGPGALEAQLPRLARADLLIDAIFGTGLARDLDSEMANAIRRLDGLPCPRLAVDIASGVDADTGAVRGAALRADMTVTFAHMKRGHWLYPGRALTGELRVVDISIPAELSARAAPQAARLLQEGGLRRLLPARARTSFKNTFGHLLVIAGAPGTGGAALLSSEAALRAGAGLVTLATGAALARSLEGRCPEVMVEGVGGGFVLGASAFEPLRELASSRNAVALGPGLGQDPDTAALARRLVRELPVPMVVDADGLNAVAHDLSCLRGAAGPRVLTPHPGEMARLAGISTGEVVAHRVALALRFAAEHGVFLVLKGADTLVATPEGGLFVNSSGNPGMATAGSGDVLTGIIGAFLAQKHEPALAARLGVYLHGAAGDLAREELGEAGLLAGDITRALPRLLLHFQADPRRGAPRPVRGPL